MSDDSLLSKRVSEKISSVVASWRCIAARGSSPGAHTRRRTPIGWHASRAHAWRRLSTRGHAAGTHAGRRISTWVSTRGWASILRWSLVHAGRRAPILVLRWALVHTWRGTPTVLGWTLVHTLRRSLLLLRHLIARLLPLDSIPAQLFSKFAVIDGTCRGDIWITLQDFQRISQCLDNLS